MKTKVISAQIFSISEKTVAEGQPKSFTLILNPSKSFEEAISLATNMKRNPEPKANPSDADVFKKASVCFKLPNGQYVINLNEVKLNKLLSTVGMDMSQFKLNCKSCVYSATAEYRELGDVLTITDRATKIVSQITVGAADHSNKNGYASNANVALTNIAIQAPPSLISFLTESVANAKEYARQKLEREAAMSVGNTFVLPESPLSSITTATDSPETVPATVEDEDSDVKVG